MYNKEEFKEKLKTEARAVKIDLNNNQLEAFYKYKEILLSWNEKINLTAITDEKEIITKHFIDSLTIAKHIKENAKIIDIGTGAGFPAIPIKILNKNLDITLVDSLNKRVEFLKILVDELKLKNIKIIHSRAEDLSIKEEYREKYDIVLSRAVAAMNVLAEYLIPFAKLKGICICMKGKNYKEELKTSKKAIDLLGGKLEKPEEISLPGTEEQRTIIIITKQNYTPRQYPRKAGTASKTPIV